MAHLSFSFAKIRFLQSGYFDWYHPLKSDRILIPTHPLYLCEEPEAFSIFLQSCLPGADPDGEG
jgi:hypothetical protein